MQQKEGLLYICGPMSFDFTIIYGLLTFFVIFFYINLRQKSESPRDL